MSAVFASYFDVYKRALLVITMGMVSHALHCCARHLLQTFAFTRRSAQQRGRDFVTLVRLMACASAAASAASDISRHRRTPLPVVPAIPQPTFGGEASVEKQDVFVASYLCGGHRTDVDRQWLWC